MRLPRLKLSGMDAAYHCISRIVGGEFLLGKEEKAKLEEMIFKVSEFSGVQIVTFKIVDNHFHNLVWVPFERLISDQELMRRVRILYGEESRDYKKLVRMMTKGGKAGRKEKDRYFQRMGDISEFNKTLKSRFTKWYNARHDRIGTLWTDRFKSLPVDSDPDSLFAVAAYIDLNAVRAGICEVPEDYPFGGYSRAVSGCEKARIGLMTITGQTDWEEFLGSYREYLYLQGGASHSNKRGCIPRKAVLKAIENNEKLDKSGLLRVRNRYFSDGLALGKKEFLNEVYSHNAQMFRYRKRNQIVPMKGHAWDDQYVIQNLRSDAYQ